jgi:tRNA dimethylallyltransferase
MNTGIFESECIALLEKLFSEKNIVVMAGGTGLYINAVINGVDALPESDEELRQQLQQTITEKGIEALQQQLKFLDEKTYRRIDISNPNRLMRAVEVCLLTGKPYSSFLQREKTKRNFIPVLIGLNTERKILYERINNRVDEMMQKGLIEEVKSFQQFKNYNALQTVGYKELFDYLDGKTTYADAVEMIKKNTRNYAKRQLTWFRKSENIHWFALDEKEKIIFFVEQVLKKNGSE